jgi:hypothetical protein
MKKVSFLDFLFILGVVLAGLFILFVYFLGLAANREDVVLR